MKSYEKYKPTRVEWIGEIPEHWTVKRLKTLSKLEYGESLAVISREEGDIQYLVQMVLLVFTQALLQMHLVLLLGEKDLTVRLIGRQRNVFRLIQLIILTTQRLTNI